MFNTKSSVSVSLVGEDLKSRKKNALVFAVEAGSMEGKHKWDTINDVGEHLRRFSRQRRLRQSPRDNAFKTVPKMSVDVRCLGRKRAG